MGKRRRRALLLTALALCVLLGGFLGALSAVGTVRERDRAAAAPLNSVAVQAGAPGPVYRVSASTALAVLATLPVKGRAPKTGYGRESFGDAWEDVDQNGCDTRNDVLHRDLSSVRVDGQSGCVVESGVLADPYTGKQIDFRRGASTSAQIQIDHVVALGDAWQKGAQQLTAAQRLGMANDPLNLIAVDGPANMKKSDGDAATWLPPNKAFRCQYVARQISVKAAYALWVSAAEKDAMRSVLSSCPQEPSLTSGL